MGFEIERKFLVINDRWKENVISRSRLQQGYLANQANASVRVRIADDNAWLNIKSTTIGISRLEFEYAIPRQDAEEMLAQSAQKPFIDKTRYRVRCGDHIWDLDQFDGENLGLVVAEVELESEDQPFEMPVWAGEEVSQDTRYYNVNLIKHPYNRW